MKRFSLVPAVALLGVLFMVLRPHTAGKLVEISNFAYAPTTVRIDPGDAVTFSNASSTTHTATCVGCPIDSGDVQPGLTKTITFPKAGTYRFTCLYHRATGMAMSVTVGRAPTPAPSPS